MTEIKQGRKRTITSIFMVPTLKIPSDRLKESGFIDGYIKDSHREIQYSNAVYLLFKPSNISKFRKFLDQEYERDKLVIDDYNYDGGFVVIVYKLDMNFEEDFNLVKESKYSKTSLPFQNLFPKIVKLMKNGLHRDEISLQYRIFNKTPDLIQYQEEKFGVTFEKGQEIWDGFREEDETLDLNKIKEYAK